MTYAYTHAVNALRLTNFRFVVTSLFAFVTCLLTAQTTFKEPSVPTPNAASLGKYTDIPVSNHTGVPNISIPIHTITEGGLSVPISLSYHSSGVRVDEVASNVGLGWTLNAGGAISRTVMGVPDESGLWKYGYNGHPRYDAVFNNIHCDKYTILDGTALAYLPNKNCWGSSGAAYYINECVFYGTTNPLAGVNCRQYFSYATGDNQSTDTEPDIFSFNFGGYTGKFVFEGQGQSGSSANVRIVPQQDLKITPYLNPLETGFQSFEVITPDGTRYYFGNSNSNDAIETGAGTYNRETSTTWYLVKVEAADRRSSINLQYEKEDYTYWTAGSQSTTHANLGQMPGSSGGTTIYPTITVVSARKIKKITTGTNSTEVNFEYNTTTPRQDISVTNTTKSYALSSIQIKNPNENYYCKRFNLTQQYFTSSTTAHLLFPTGDDADRYRLKLTSVQEVSCDGSKEIPAYQFTYNETGNIGRRASFGRDAWGYYNGYDDNKGLLPSSDNGMWIISAQYAGDRRVDADKMKYWSLKKIQYPTGGSTEFSYEAHKTLSNLETIGGLRVKTIEFKNSDGSLVSRKNYDYGSGTLYSGSYKAFDIINLNYRIPDSIKAWMTLPCNFGDMIIAGARPPLNSTQGYHIGYTEVTVTDMDGTGTRYRYKNMSPSWQGYLKYPYAPQQTVIGRGDLEKEEKLNTTGGVVASTEFFYETVAERNIRARKVGAIYGIGSNGNYCSGPIYVHNEYFITTARYRMTQKTETVDNIETKTFYTYNANNEHGNPIETRVVNSDGKESKTKTYYAHNLMTDHPNYSIRANLINQNIVGVPLEVRQFTGTTLVGGGAVKSGVFGQYFNGAFLIFYPEQYFTIDRNGNRILKTTVNLYTALGQPSKVTNANHAVSTYFNWTGVKLDNKVIKTGDNATDLLKWQYSYIPNTLLVDAITDENGYKTAFSYDALQRLTEVTSFYANQTFKSSVNYQYNYGTYGNNFVGNTATFANMSGISLSVKQYFDGLGRAIGGVKESYTPKSPAHPNDAWHQKAYVTYDQNGRQDRAFQPFENANTGFQAAPSGTPSSQTIYEPNALSRPIKQIAEDGTFTTMAYGTNAVGEVIKFNVATAGTEFTNTVSANSTYDANTLSKTIVTNENGKQTCVFKDKLGRVILTRKTLNGQNVDTYNVYDDWGSLVMVIPPDAVTGTAPNFTITTNLTFRYKYDSQNRLCEKIIPGADAQRFYYNNRDMVVLSQDGNQRVKNSNVYYATLYDDLGRKKETGWVWTSSPVSHAAATTSDRNTYNWSELGDLYYYAPTGNRLTGVRGFAVGNRKPTDEFYIGDAYYYDAKGDMTSRSRGLLTGQTNWRDMTYNAAGKLTQSIEFLNGMNGRQVWLTNQFEYDHALRPVRQNNNLWYPTSSGTKYYDWVSLSNTKYNYLDQVVEKNLGSNRWNDNTFLQSVDYSYNVRGWLTGINQTGLSNETIPLNGGSVDPSAFVIQSNDFGKVDLFGQTINYGTPTTYGSLTPTPQYNGNISQTIWQVAGRERQGYNYTYDDLDRLTNGTYFDLSGTSNTPTTDNKFAESLTYDKRGNIVSLTRKGLAEYSNTCNGSYKVCGFFKPLDALTYTYNDKNQVTKIIDDAIATKGFRYANSGQTADYTYDANGNMTSDKNKGITAIKYNFLNLPETIEFGKDNRIEFVYASTGAKLRKTVFLLNKPPTQFDYLEEAEYVEGKLERVGLAEGQLRLEECYNCDNDPFLESKNGNVSMKWVYEYVLKDHLGNTRVTFGDRNNDWQINPNTEVTQINHYYPFGLNMEGNWNGAQGSNKYQYNGKEWNDDFGLEWNDYGARFYDPASGRWLSPDPLAEKFLNWSPYNYGLNDPVNVIDPNGMESEWINGGIRLSGQDAQDAFKKLQQDSQNSGNENTEESPNDEYQKSKDKNGNTIYTKIGNTGGNEYDIIHEGCIPCANHQTSVIVNPYDPVTSERVGHGDWKPRNASGGLESADPIIDAIAPELKIAKFLGLGKLFGAGAKFVAMASLLTTKGSSLAALGIKDGMSTTAENALELGMKFLGKGYKEAGAGTGRFVSADGMRVFRMGVTDILGKHGGGPHVNFETLVPNPVKPGKMMVAQNYHVYITP